MSLNPRAESFPVKYFVLEYVSIFWGGKERDARKEASFLADL